jgi:ABC-type multidrug transport system permease subunit
MKKMLAIIEKEIIHTRRNPRQAVILFLFPIVTILVVGTAFGGGFYRSNDLPTVIVIGDGVSDEIPDMLAALDTFDADIIRGSVGDARDAVKNGEYLVGIHLARRMTMIVDNEDPVITPSVTEALKQVSSTSGTIEQLHADRAFIDYIVPGIVAIMIAFMAVDLASLSIVEERVNKTLHRILSSTTKTGEILLGKLLAHLVFTALGAVLVVIIGVFIFDASFAGDAVTVALVILGSSIMFLAYALTMSAAGRTLMEAHFACDSSLIPMLLLCGAFFPLYSMVPLLRSIAEILPLTYVFTALRDSMVKGADLGEIATPLLAISLYAIAFAASGILLFKKE